MLCEIPCTCFINTMWGSQDRPNSGPRGAGVDVYPCHTGGGTRGHKVVNLAGGQESLHREYGTNRSSQDNCVSQVFQGSKVVPGRGNRWAKTMKTSNVQSIQRNSSHKGTAWHELRSWSWTTNQLSIYTDSFILHHSKNFSMKEAIIGLSSGAKSLWQQAVCWLATLSGTS